MTEDGITIKQKMGEGIGYKLLTGMGWSEGKGLGAKENGSATYLRVKKKINSSGVGAEGSGNDWLTNTVAFNSVLANLNKTHGTDKNTGTDNSTNISTQAIHQKSITIEGKRNTLPCYTKLAKAKSMRNYTETDLKEILGESVIKRNKIENKVTKIITPKIEESKRGEDSSDKIPGEFKSLTSTFTINDYFKTKLQAMDKSKLPIDNQNSSFDSSYQYDTRQEDSIETNNVETENITQLIHREGLISATSGGLSTTSTNCLTLKMHTILVSCNGLSLEFGFDLC